MQDLLVALIVAACAGYAVWVLMPTVLRRSLARHALAWPWPEALAVHLRRWAQAPSGCGCNGCDAGTPVARDDGAKPIRIHRQPKA